MPDPTMTIALAPLAEAVNPIVNAVVSVALGAAGTYAAYLYHRWTGREMAEADKAVLRQAAKDGAGVIFAEAEAGFSSASVKTSDPIVATAVGKIVAALPAVMAATGVTPDAVAHMVTAEVGRLQSTSPSVAAASTVKATLAPSAEQTEVVSTAVAGRAAANNGQSATDAAVPAALTSAGVVSQPAGHKL